jgi:hypothetical protein
MTAKCNNLSLVSGSRQRPSPGIEEGKIIMKIVDAAYQSAEQGKAIDLN